MCAHLLDSLRLLLWRGCGGTGRALARPLLLDVGCEGRRAPDDRSRASAVVPQAVVLVGARDLCAIFCAVVPAIVSAAVVLGANNRTAMCQRVIFRADQRSGKTIFFASQHRGKTTLSHIRRIVFFIASLASQLSVVGC